jgi:hypothetical protein
MLQRSFLYFLLIVLVVVGCKTTRPISDSGYEAGRWGNSGFSAELSEFDIIGLAPEGKVTEADLATTAATPYFLA